MERDADTVEPGPGGRKKTSSAASGNGSGQRRGDDSSDVSREPNRREKRTADYKNPAEFLDNLYSGKAEKLFEDQAEAGKVNEAFNQLESQLGDAGRKCIDQYHKWGQDFWRRDEAQLLTGLLNGYWSQVMIVTANRKRIMHEMRATDEYLVPPVTTEMVKEFNKGLEEMSDKMAPNNTSLYRNIFGDELRLEVGHLKSMINRIHLNTRDPKRKQTWIELVNTEMTKWKGDKKGNSRVNAKARKQVLNYFADFLTNGVTDSISAAVQAWNILIASTVLWKYYQGFIIRDIFPKVVFADEFVKRVYQEVEAQLAGWESSGWTPTNFKDPDQGGLPQGYIFFIKTFDADPSELRDIWECIDWLESDDKLGYDVDIDQIALNMKQTLGNCRGRRTAVEKSQKLELSDEEDPSTNKDMKRATARAEKRKKDGSSSKKDDESSVLDEGVDVGGSDQNDRITNKKLIATFAEVNNIFTQFRKAETNDDKKKFAGQLVQLINAPDTGYLRDFLSSTCLARGETQVKQASLALNEDAAKQFASEAGVVAAMDASINKMAVQSPRVESPSKGVRKRGPVTLPKSTAAKATSSKESVVLAEQLKESINTIARQKEWQIISLARAFPNLSADDMKFFQGQCSVVSEAAAGAGIETESQDINALLQDKSMTTYVAVKKAENNLYTVLGFIIIAKNPKLPAFILPRSDVNLIPSAGLEAGIEQVIKPGFQAKGSPTMFDIRMVCSTGKEPDVCTLLVFYSLASEIALGTKPSFELLTSNVAYLNDFVYDYLDEKQFRDYLSASDQAFLNVNNDLKFRVAQTNAVCWLVNIFDFRLAFPPMALSKTDSKCRDYSNVRAAMIEQSDKYWTWTTLYKGGSQIYQIAQPDKGLRIVARPFPTINQLIDLFKRVPDAKLCQPASEVEDCEAITAARSEKRKSMEEGAPKRVRE